MPTEKIDTAMFAPCGMNCLVRIVSLFASTVWKGSWNSRKENILVQNVGVSFLSMTESVASVKKA